MKNKEFKLTEKAIQYGLREVRTYFENLRIKDCSKVSASRQYHYPFESGLSFCQAHLEEVRQTFEEGDLVIWTNTDNGQKYFAEVDGEQKLGELVYITFIETNIAHRAFAKHLTHTGRSLKGER